MQVKIRLFATLRQLAGWTQLTLDLPAEATVSAALAEVDNRISISGHTDAAGKEAANLMLSRARAEAVRRALIARGIPREGLRAIGAGSQSPLPGLDPADTANRRIEFSVIEPMRLQPTPVDTPGPG